jgi:hypothetical protein
VGGLLAAWVEPVFKWNSRVESFVAAGLLIAGCILALWLKKRLFGRLEVWDAIIPLLVLSPATHETFLGVTHFSHGPIPFLLLLLIAFSFTIRRPRLRYSLIGLLAALSISTGPGFIAGFAVPAVVFLDWRRSDREHRRWMVLSCCLIAAAWLLFFYHYSVVNKGCPPPSESFRTHNPIYYALFAAFMFSTAAGSPATHYLITSMSIGFAVLGVLLYAVWKARATSRATSVPVLLILFALVFVTMTAAGRMCLGLGVALGSRYVIYVAPALLGGYLLALSAAMRIRTMLLSLILVFAVVGPGTLHPSQLKEISDLSAHRSAWRACYLSKHNLLECNVETHASVLTYPNNIQEKLDFLEQHHLNLFANRW